jgi:hypothetical protein
MSIVTEAVEARRLAEFWTGFLGTQSELNRLIAAMTETEYNEYLRAVASDPAWRSPRSL